MSPLLGSPVLGSPLLGSPLSEFAPAKVNLHLHIVGRREDGYHLLDSLAVFAGIGDWLTVSPGDGLTLSVTGPFAAGLEGESDNLVLRAARALAAHGGVEAAGRLVLEKNLPVASGIGGGSADAAAALRLLCRFWRLEPGAIGVLARGLGADVPVCVAGRPALMSGIGDVLSPVPKLPDVGIVLVNPGVAVSTPAVFRARGGPFSAAADLPAHGWLDAAALVAMLRSTRNDLEPAARLLSPAIGGAMDAVAAAPGCLLARMSGSGATCFGLFPTPVAAEAAARTIARDGWWVWGGGFIGG
ncbi:MAG: 4-diphosphocytidyl-2-C-methyl-D-erythritol kinase [Rhodopila sp.]|nr:4-diphosphocytidyl-2-C-methyl-D-erythritol kinase [Rhodopila sp.]